MQGRRANDIKQSVAWEATQGGEVSSPNSLSFILFYYILSYFTQFKTMYLILGEVSLVVSGVFVGLKHRGSHEIT